MKTINLLFAVHNHQPIGNLDPVFQEGWEKCYRPFLEALEKHPGFRISLHYSGSLWEWLEANQPDGIARLQALTARRQVEILSGGFYEPLLPFIPEKDAVGQIRLLNQFLKKKVGVQPKGFWLAERVWCPTLPKIIAGTGMNYTIVDDTHFRFAGLPPEEMFGYYVTEYEGHPLALFPIKQQLRYAIPFRNPEETIDALRFWATEEGDYAVTYADNGEKFGLWPGTYHWVVEESWLERFIQALERNSDWIRLLTFTEYLEKFPPQGRIYLPSSSYEEMMEWALPSISAIAYADLVAELKASGRFEKFRPFLRGGSWENFLVKYPESNQMHKKMLFVSSRVHRILEKNPSPEKAKESTPSPCLRALWKGQSNNAYWHGLFGGLYMRHLRHSVYRNLIAAEKQAEILEGRKGALLHHEILDLDMDRQKEIWVTSPDWGGLIKPGYGGALVELDFRPQELNLINSLTRRPEAYHRKLKGNQGNPFFSNAPGSLSPSSTDVEWADLLMYDWYNRYSFLDHFLGEETTFEQFRRCQYPELGCFINQPYELIDIKENEDSGRLAVRLRRRGGIWRPEGKIPTEITKKFIFRRDQASVAAEYDIINRGPAETRFWFGVELNLTLDRKEEGQQGFLTPETKEGGLPGDWSTAAAEIETLALREESMGLEFFLHPDPPSDLWHFPLETVSQSEKGFEKTVQGSVFLLHWRFALRPGEKKRVSLRLSRGDRKDVSG